MPILTDDEREGTSLSDGKYALSRVIGRGGMATVFEGLHTWTGRKVAVKVIHASLTVDAEKAQRYLQEARAATSLEHPNVVEVLDMGREESDGAVYIVFELLRGESLRDRLERVGTIDAFELAALMLPILDALATAHARGIVHRDLKPDNIFLQDDGQGGVRPKLLDFGIAKMDDGGAYGTGPVSGTVEYLSPERAQGHPSAPTGDVWSLGVLMYECLTGALPFDRETVTATLLAIVQEPVPSLAAYPNLHRPIAEVVERCLVRVLARRYRDAGELRDALLEATHAPASVSPLVSRPTLPEPVSGMTMLPGAATPSSPPEAIIVARTPVRTAPRGRRGAALLTAALLTLVLVGLWRASIPEDDRTASVETLDAVDVAPASDPAAEPSATAPDVTSATDALPAPAIADEIRVGSAPSVTTDARPARAAAPQSPQRAASMRAARTEVNSVGRPLRGANGSLILD